MQHPRVLCLAAGVALFAAAFFVAPCEPKEPMFRGKTLTQWISEAHDIGIFEQTDELNAATSAMGTNALPFLLREFTRPSSRLRTGLCAIVNKHPKIHLSTDEARVYMARQGLMLLGTNTAPALPELERYLDDPERGKWVRDIFYNFDQGTFWAR